MQKISKPQGNVKYKAEKETTKKPTKKEIHETKKSQTYAKRTSKSNLKYTAGQKKQNTIEKQRQGLKLFLWSGVEFVGNVSKYKKLLLM